MRFQASGAFCVVLGIVVVGAKPSDDRENAVLEAALGGVAHELITDEVRATGAVVCLQIDPGGAPQSISREFLRRFKNVPFMRRGAECEARPNGCVELASGAPALILTAGPIEWVTGDDAHVRITYRWSKRDFGNRIYRVVQEPTGWILLGQVIKMSPA